MNRSGPVILFATLLLRGVAPAAAAIVSGGGNRSLDCMTVLDVPGANSPAPPKTPKNVDCVDGDPTCDADGVVNARCVFDVSLCVNSTAVPNCAPLRTNLVTIDHALDNGDPKFDTDFQALQARVGQITFPTTTLDRCTAESSITVVLSPPRSSAKPWKTNKKKLRVVTLGNASGRNATDADHMRFTCRPAKGGFYTPRDLYAGTFDRIAQQVFAQSCALSGCHDSQTHQNDMVLLPGAAYSQIVGVTPYNPVAAADGLERIFPGDPQMSFLYRKITDPQLPEGYGGHMPKIGPSVTPALAEIIRLWIIGDGILGPAPEAGWVAGTDQ